MATQDLWGIIKKASKPYRDLDAEYVLVGTAALWAHGYLIYWSDVDFLSKSCIKDPRVDTSIFDSLSTETEFECEYGVGSIHGVVLGRKVDYIMSLPSTHPFISPEPVMINGVAVATVNDIINLKKGAGREKDDKFLAKWYAGTLSFMD